MFLRALVRARAILRGGEAISEIEPWSVWPEHDLALIRVNVPEGASVSSLRLSEGEPLIAEDVWALGHPQGMGFTATHGTVNALREFGEIAEALRLPVEYSVRSRWLQTDCPINAGNSGGPLVSAAGEVVGVNTWHAAEGNDQFFALSAKHVREIIEARPPYPCGFGASTPLAVADARASRLEALPRLALVPLPTEPIPSITVSRGTDTRAISAAALQCEQARRCAACWGDGSDDRVGARSTSRSRFPAGYKDRKTQNQCKICGGTGFGNSRSIAGRARRFAEEFAACQPKSTRLDREVRDAIWRVVDATCDDPVATATVMANDCERVFSDVGRRGQAVVLFGFLERREVRDGTLFEIVRMVPGDRLILCSEPLYSNGALGEPALVGGVYAGKVKGSDNGFWPVVQGGFTVVPY